MKIELFTGKVFLLMAQHPDATEVLYNGFDESHARDVESIKEDLKISVRIFIEEAGVKLLSFENGEQIGEEWYIDGEWEEQEVESIFDRYQDDDEDDTDEPLSENIELFSGILDIDEREDD